MSVTLRAIRRTTTHTATHRLFLRPSYAPVSRVPLGGTYATTILNRSFASDKPKKNPPAHRPKQLPYDESSLDAQPHDSAPNPSCQEGQKHGGQGEKEPRDTNPNFRRLLWHMIRYLYKDKKLLKRAGFCVSCWVAIYYFLKWHAAEIPITGRKRPKLFNPARPPKNDNKPDGNLTHLSPGDSPEAQMLHRILERIVAAAGLEDLAWELYLESGPPRTSLEDEIAAVLAHDVSHMLARHDLEVNSHFLAGLLYLAPPLSVFNKYAFLGFFLIVGYPLILLPLRLRKMEIEADLLGLFIMTDAGFNPRGALSLHTWKEQIREDRYHYVAGDLPPRQTRIKNISHDLPQVLEIVRGCPPDLESVAVDEGLRQRWEQFKEERDRKRLEISKLGATE
ncbi:hypothetical protein F4778DRAFT_794789 [Xylariomycetidae sp. FL2044]|nr:hypothetical protein F4778DRAFT_794789 [Xylariomycetidae sp. FL2044]